MNTIAPAFSDEPVGDMKQVTCRRFHAIHDKASKAEKRVSKANLDKLSAKKLLRLYDDLCAGQNLTDAEDGPDRMYAHSYDDSISKVRAAICKKK